MQISKINIGTPYSFGRERRFDLLEAAGVKSVSEIKAVTRNDAGDVFIVTVNKSGSLAAHSVPDQSFEKVNGIYKTKLAEEEHSWYLSGSTVDDDWGGVVAGLDPGIYTC